MSERRGFFRSLGRGALGAVAFGAVPTAALAANNVAKPHEDLSKFAPPDNCYNIQIKGSYDVEPEEVMRISSDGMLGIGSNFYGSKRTTHSVTMSVGKDNRLWIKVGDEWHRVALEG